MEKSLRNYAQAGITLKRFTFIRDGKLFQSKPTKKETFVIVEDLLGNRSLLWVACVENGKEKWRHSINDIVRITYSEPV